MSFENLIINRRDSLHKSLNAHFTYEVTRLNTKPKTARYVSVSIPGKGSSSRVLILVKPVTAKL